jgi:hypothetical protein
MTKASADVDRLGATERRVHSEPGRLTWLSLANESSPTLRQS